MNTTLKTLPRVKALNIMWKTLRGLIKSKTKTVGSSITADMFNDYFTNIGPSINKQFPKETVLHWTQPDCLYTLQLSELDENDIHSDLSSLSSDSNLDILSFDSQLLKLGADVLVSSLTVLFNMSIKSGSIPNDFKKARVTPIYKGKGSTDDPGSYRPISGVPHIAKLLEKQVQAQLLSYFEQHDFITCHQSAFLRGHSTQTALHKLTDDILSNVNDGYVTSSCFFRFG